MLRGHYARYDELIHRVWGANGTYTRIGAAPNAVNIARNVSQFATFPFEHIDGINLEIETGYYGTIVPPGEKYFYRLSIPALAITGLVTGDGFKTNMDTHVRFENLEIWFIAEGRWLVTWDKIEWYIEGSLHATYAINGSLMSEPGFVAPGYIPLFGVPGQISGTSTTNIAPTQYAVGEPILGTQYIFSPATESAWEVTASWDFGGGWRFREDGVTTALPVVLTPVAVPPGTSCSTAASVEDMTASNTYDFETSSSLRMSQEVSYSGEFECHTCPDGSVAAPPAIYDSWRVTSEYFQTHAQAHMIPNLAKNLVRLSFADYYALWLRYGFPAARAGASRTCFTGSWTDCDNPNFEPIVDNATGYAHPRLSAMLSAVGPSIHDIEEPLGWTTWAPHARDATSIEHRYYLVTLKSPGGCGLVDPPEDEDADPPIHPSCCAPGDRYYRYNLAVSGFGTTEQRLVNPQMHPALDHLDNYIRYINYNANPHWSFFLYGPPDGDAVHWWCEGAKRTWDEYWGRIREQHIDHTSLPASERRKTRNSIVSEPLLDGQLAPLVKTVFTDVNSSWVGISRFHAQAFSPVSSLTLSEDSEAAWSFVGCSATFSPSTITLTPAVTDIVAELDLSRFDVEPFMFAHLATRFTINGSMTNVAAINVYLVSQQGDRVLLTSTLSSMQIVRPTGEDDYFAGSWAIDHGNGVVTDEGADVAPGGVSAATMADPELVHFFSLLGGRTAVKLRYEIEVMSTSADVTINYPTFWSTASVRECICENGATQVILVENGPGIRFGNWDWYDEVLDQLRDTPQIRSFGHASNIIDALIYKRLVARAEAKDDGLLDEIGNILQSQEWGGELSSLSIGTHAFCYQHVQTSPPLLQRPIVLVSVNSLRELPPLCTFPKRVRNAVTLALSTGSNYDQRAYSLISEPRRIFRSQFEAHIEAPGPSREQWTVIDNYRGVSGWKYTSHRHALTNDEGDGFFIVDANGEDLATASPWHSYFTTGLADRDELGEIHQCWTKCGALLAVIVTPERMRLHAYNFDAMNRFRTVIEASDIDAAQVAWRPEGTAVIAYLQGGEVKRIQSRDWGETWSTPEMIATGEGVAIATDWHSGIEYLAVHNGTAWVCYRSVDGQTFMEAGTIVVAPVARAGLEVHPGVERPLVWIGDVGSGQIAKYTSLDRGESWEEI